MKGGTSRKDLMSLGIIVSTNIGYHNIIRRLLMIDWAVLESLVQNVLK